jgi:hypothetical protein
MPYNKKLTQITPTKHITYTAALFNEILKTNEINFIKNQNANVKIK